MSLRLLAKSNSTKVQQPFAISQNVNYVQCLSGCAQGHNIRTPPPPKSMSMMRRKTTLQFFFTRLGGYDTGELPSVKALEN